MFIHLSRHWGACLVKMSNTKEFLISWCTCHKWVHKLTVFSLWLLVPAYRNILSLMQPGELVLGVRMTDFRNNFFTASQAGNKILQHEFTTSPIHCILYIHNLSVWMILLRYSVASPRSMAMVLGHVTRRLDSLMAVISAASIHYFLALLTFAL